MHECALQAFDLGLQDAVLGGGMSNATLGLRFGGRKGKEAGGVATS
jgi:hypothetical protein